MPQIGWIGVGNMGKGMLGTLATKYNTESPILVFNRNNTRSEEFAAKVNSEHGEKLAVAPSLGDLVQKSDIIFSIVANDAAIKETVQTAIDSGSIKGKLWIDSSTVSPDTTNEISELIISKGGRFCAAPVFGVPAVAAQGNLIWVLASSDEKVIDEVIPFTKGVMGRAFIDLRGKPPGTALLLKLSGNHFVLAMTLTISESMALANQDGLGEEAILHFVTEMFGGPYVGYATRMLNGDYARPDPLFAVDLALKDANHINTIAKRHGITLGTIDEAIKRLNVVKEQRGPTGDMAGMYGAIRTQSGLPYVKEKTD